MASQFFYYGPNQDMCMTFSVRNDNLYKKYLNALLKQYDTVSLPVHAKAQQAPLDAVFQPCQLRQGPCTFLEDEDAAVSRTPIRVNSGLEALAHSPTRRMMVLGDSGMGKTTLLKDLLCHATHNALENTNATIAPLPLFISLPDLARSGLTLQTYLPRLLTHLNLDQDCAPMLVEAIVSGQALLCLDGLDEVIPALRPALIAHLDSEALRSGGTWVIGSRLAEYKGGQFTPGSFATWELQALDKQTRDDLAHRLFPILTQTSNKPALAPEPFLHAVENDYRLATWCARPLFFSLAATLYVHDGSLPASPAALYRAVLDLTLSQQRAEQSQVSRHMLADIALQLYQSNGNDVSVPETYSFTHQAFREYLVALALAQQLCSNNTQEQEAAWDFAWHKRLYSRWHEILCLLVGVLIQEYGADGGLVATHWLQKLADQHNRSGGDIGHLSRDLALRSLREYPPTQLSPELEQVAQTLVLDWAKQVLTEEQSKARGLSSEIGLLDLHLVLPALSYFEEHKYTRNDLYSSFSFFEVPAKVLEAAYQHTHGVSLYASAQSETLQQHASQATLIALLMDKTEPWSIRESAAQWLGKWRQQVPVEPLSTTLLDPDNYYRVRIAAAEALAELGEHIPLAPLLAAAQDEQDIVRAAAIRALGHDGAQVPLATLFAALRDAGVVRQDAEKALLILQPTIDDITPWLGYLQDAQAEVRRAFIEIFGARIPEALLLKMLRDPAWEVRRASVHALGTVGEQARQDALLAALRDENKDVRAEAALALGRMGARAPMPVLLDALRNESKQVRRAILTVLEERHEPVPSATLIHLVQQSSLRLEALELTQKLHLTLPADLLLTVLQEGKNGEANKAASLLAQMGPQAPIAQLLDIVADQTSPVREEASAILLQLAPYVPLEPIRTVLATEPASPVYHLLVHVLLRRGISLPVATLLKALEPEARRNADQEKNAVILALADAEAEPLIEALLQTVPEALGDDWGLDTPATTLLKPLATQITPAMLLHACQHRISDEIVALKVLGVMQQDAPINLMRSIMQDEQHDWHVRKYARRVLQYIGEPLPIEILLQETDEKYIDYDREMVRALSIQGPAAPIQELLTLLGHSRSVIQKTAAEALCELGPYVPTNDIIPALRDRVTPWKSINSMRVCSMMGEHAPIAELTTMLHTPNENHHIRLSALHALADLHAYVPVETILAAIRDKDQKIRRHGLQVLAKWGATVPIEPLRALLDDKHYEPRHEVILALGRLKERTPVELLLHLMHSENANDELPAVEALSKLGEQAPISELLAFLHDEHGEIRPHVLKELGYLGRYAPLDLIVEALDHEERYTASNAKEALATLAHTAPASLLTLSLDTPHVSIRHAIMQAIVNLGPAGPGELAITALADPGREVRRLACKALVQSDIDLALIPLGPLLRPLNEECNVTTYYSEYQGYGAELRLLAKCGPRIPSEALLAVFGHHHIKASENAARALYSTHPAIFRAVVVPQAEAILRGEPTGGVFAAHVQSRIADLVRQIGRATPAVLDLLTEMLDWPYWEVRSTAAEALGTIQRNIPDRALHKLHALLHDPQSHTVRMAAEKALTEIFSYADGMEEETEG
ncbi:MAG TPA: HEAT repeat domain-containing protein [Ktedonobacteraceae bacterium]|nr:HEAT repeat domain-containing protein [Ktedonobacteraceae bacterium]